MNQCGKSFTFLPLAQKRNFSFSSLCFLAWGLVWGLTGNTHQAAATSNTYSGHGAESISPEVLKRYAPQPIPSDLSSKIQSLLDVRSPSLGLPAPTGDKLYFNWTVTGTLQAWKLNNPLSFPIQLTGGEDRTRVVGVVPDGKTLVISRDRKGEEYPGLYLQSVEGGPLRVIQHKAKVQTTFAFASDDSRYIYYRANDIKPDSYAIYSFDIKTGKKQLIFSQEGFWFVADHWGKQGDKNHLILMVKATGSLSREYYTYQPETKKLTPLFGQGETEDYQATFSTSPDELLVLTPKFGEFRRLYSWKDGKYKAITPEFKYNVEFFEIDHPRTRIVYQVNEKGYYKVKALNAKTHIDIKLPQFKKADHVWAGATSHNGRYTTFGIETATAPRLSYVYDWKTQKLTQWLLPSSPEVDTGDFANASLEYYPARDGTKIPMFVYRPAKCQAPCPVVAIFHGGPESQAIPGFNPRAQLLVKEGFVVVEPNVRGSDGYGKTWLAADDGPKRLDIITDIEDCAKYIKSEWKSNGKSPRIAIMGGSYGGYSALVGMSMFAGAYDAGVAIVSISNLITFLENTAPYRRSLRISEYGDPVKDKEALQKLSPIFHIEKVKDPLLLVHGANDPRTPAGEAIQMHEALQKRGVSSDLIIFADEGHGMAKRENRVLELGHSIRFLKQHLQSDQKSH